MCHGVFVSSSGLSAVEVRYVLNLYDDSKKGKSIILISAPFE